MKYIFVVGLVLFTACATASRINRVSLGMNKGQVIDEMGDPNSSKASGDTEVLEYLLTASSTEAIRHHETPYWVVIKDGKVVQYGRAGDFGNMLPTTIRVQEQRVPASN